MWLKGMVLQIKLIKKKKACILETGFKVFWNNGASEGTQKLEKPVHRSQRLTVNI